MDSRKCNTIDEYIEGFPTEIQSILRDIRETIRASVPGAEEAIVYQIPTFRFCGNLVHLLPIKITLAFIQAPLRSKLLKKRSRVTKPPKARFSFHLISRFHTV